MTEKFVEYHASSPSRFCPFCSVDESRIVWSSERVLAIRDGFPVSAGHSLIMAKRHVASWGSLTSDEKAGILTGIDVIRGSISTDHKPDAFNIGFNDGVAAGQTVMHFHVHVIPRYSGDASDPRGGIRWVLPDKAAYWRGLEE